MNVDTSGLQELILQIIKMIGELDLKNFNLDYLSTLLTAFSPIWNPIWRIITAFLETWFGL